MFNNTGRSNDKSESKIFAFCNIKIGKTILKWVVIACVRNDTFEYELV